MLFLGVLLKFTTLHDNHNLARIKLTDLCLTETLHCSVKGYNSLRGSNSPTNKQLCADALLGSTVQVSHWQQVCHMTRLFTSYQIVQWAVCYFECFRIALLLAVLI